MKISAFGAMARNRVVGRANQLPWSLPADLKRFKRMTSGHPVIMGRKTYESMGKPLPNRDNLVVTRRAGFSAPGCHVFSSVEDALDWCRKREAEGRAGFEEAFVIGGGEIWSSCWGLIERVYLTIIHQDFDGDAWFPEFDWSEFRISFQEDHSDPMPFTYYTLDRK
jgi:dihydrofolate reductase